MPVHRGQNEKDYMIAGENTQAREKNRIMTQKGSSVLLLQHSIQTWTYLYSRICFRTLGGLENTLQLIFIEGLLFIIRFVPWAGSIILRLNIPLLVAQDTVDSYTKTNIFYHEGAARRRSVPRRSVQRLQNHLHDHK